MNHRPTTPRLTLTRRGFLASAAIAGAASVLTGCGGGEPTSGQSGGGAGAKAVKLPALTEAKTVKPDLPGTPAGVQPAFFRYPTELVQTVPEPPGSGEELTSMVVTYGTTPPESAYREAVNKAIGSPISLMSVSDGDYPQRFSTVVAGGDLPDTMLIPLFANLPLVGEFLKAKCVDLSDNLSSDAVAKYPNLAAVPTAAWRNARVNGKIYGVPIPRNVFNRAPFYRKDLVDKRGVELPTTADEFTKFCKEFTKPKAGKYAIAGFLSGAINPMLLILISGMFDVPNQWRNENGKLTYYIETPEFKESLAYTKSLWEAGVYYPETPSMSSAKAGNLLQSGDCIITENGNTGWARTQSEGEVVQPAFLLDALPAFGAEGGPGSIWFKEGAFGYSVITKGAEARTEEILGIMNYCAAPFGSQEYDLLNFGVEGVNHKVTDKGPVLTEQGKAEIITSYNYIGAPEQVLFDAEYVEEYVKPAYAWEEKLAPVGIDDPTVGLYSKTASRNIASLKTAINDQITAIVVGRQDISALDDMIASWKSGGGTEIQNEYQEALQAAG